MPIDISRENDAFNLTWKCNPIHIGVYATLYNYFKRTRDYSDSEQKRKHIKHVLETSNEQFKTRVEFEQCLAIRNNIMHTLIIRNIGISRSKIAKIVAEYDAGIDIITLSRTHRVPPRNLLRSILSHKKYLNLDLLFKNNDIKVCR